MTNEEVRAALVDGMKNSDRKELVNAIHNSDRLLKATIDKEEEAVTTLISESRMANTAPVFYNNEQALRYVVILACISAIGHYATFQEFPSGKGFVDLLFIPKTGSTLPPLLIELKWDKAAETAITQIKEGDYMQAVRRLGFKERLLLVGISYIPDTKMHTARIEEKSL